MHRSQLKYVLASLALLAGSPFARGAVIINVNQVGSDVVAAGSGTINLAGLSFNSTGSAPTPRFGPVPAVLLGPTAGAPADFYTGFTGPAIGNGTYTNPTFGSGDEFGFVTSSLLVVPQGYLSGAALAATDTYAGATFATLGLTPGTYLYTWGIGQTADSLTVQVGPAPVPLPSASAGGLALLGTSLLRRRRRRRARR